MSKRAQLMALKTLMERIDIQIRGLAAFLIKTVLLADNFESREISADEPFQSWVVKKFVWMTKTIAESIAENSSCYLAPLKAAPLNVLASLKAAQHQKQHNLLGEREHQPQRPQQSHQERNLKQKQKSFQGCCSCKGCWWSISERGAGSITPQLQEWRDLPCNAK